MYFPISMYFPYVFYLYVFSVCIFRMYIYQYTALTAALAALTAALAALTAHRCRPHGIVHCTIYIFPMYSHSVNCKDT